MEKILMVGMTFSFSCGVAKAGVPSSGCSEPTTTSALERQQRAQAALDRGSYGWVQEELKSYVAVHPEQCELRLLLGKAYLYSGRDRAAERQFAEVLARDPANETALLELGRLNGYHSRYAQSNALYKKLLQIDPGDENANIGLARNLIDTDEMEKARAAIKAGLAAHPNSLRLQELQDQIAEQEDEIPQVATKPLRTRRTSFQDWTYIITDSVGDSIFENLSRSEEQLSKRAFVHVTTRIRHLSSQGGIVEIPDQNAESEGGPTISGTTFEAGLRLDYHLTKWLNASGGVGGVRFNNGSYKGLFRGSLEVHRGSFLYFKSTYLRTPVIPTQDAETFHLTSQGVRNDFDWTPPQWRVHSSFSELQYSDTNRRHEQDLDTLRWFGTSHVGLGTGFSLDHLAFDQFLNHGYFSPGDYLNYMGAASVRVQHYHHFNGEYKVNLGAESIEPSPFRFVYEISAENMLRLGKWDLHANYTFDHATQSTGAFQTNFTSLGVRYAF